VTEESFGHVKSGEEVKVFTLDDGEGLVLKVISYGAAINSIKVGEKKTDVALGFDSLEGYLSDDNPYMGAVVGRVANRIANGRFTLDGIEHQLALNCGPNAHHGGLVGLDKVLWNHSVDHKKGEVAFSYLSKDGEEGYPGDVIYNVVYGLKYDGALSNGEDSKKVKGFKCVRVEMRAMVTAPTPINMVTHGYFNLAGHHMGLAGLHGHIITMPNARDYTPINENQIPTGEIASVDGTVFDLTSPTRLGDVLDKCPGGQYNGFDHNLVLMKVKPDNSYKPIDNSALAHVSSVVHKQSGRSLQCYSDQPGVHLYTANFFPSDESFKGKEGAIYKKHGAFCLETQKYPDSVNHPNFPSSIIRPGETYLHTVLYQFEETKDD